MIQMEPPFFIWWQRLPGFWGRTFRNLDFPKTCIFVGFCESNFISCFRKNILTVFLVGGSKSSKISALGGGFQDFLSFFPEIWAEMIQFDQRIFFRWVVNNYQRVWLYTLGIVSPSQFCTMVRSNVSRASSTWNLGDWKSTYGATGNGGKLHLEIHIECCWCFFWYIVGKQIQGDGFVRLFFRISTPSKLTSETSGWNQQLGLSRHNPQDNFVFSWY